MLPVHESLRENLEDEVMSMMIYLTAAVAAFLLFVYLIVALVRPEWF